MKGTRLKRWAAGLALLALAVSAAGCGTGANDKAESSAGTAPMAETANVAADALATSRDQGGGELKDGAKSMSAGSQPAAKSQEQAASGAGAAKDAAGKGGSGTAGFASAEASGQDGLNRKLIYKANVTMKVKDYGAAQSEIRDLVTLAGGYILQFSENNTVHEQGGQFTLKIPSGGFSSFLKDLEKIPVLSPVQRSMQGQDVSEEYVDLDSRLKAKQILEARYMEFMQKATKTDELVAFTNELGKIQEEIERIKGRMRYIDQNVAFSTVEIRIYQPAGKADPGGPVEKPSVLQRAGDAMSASFGFLSGFGQGLLVLLAGSLPVLAVLAIVGVPVWLGLLNGARKRKEREARAEAERLRRLEHNRMLAGRDGERQERGDSDTERQGGGE